MTANHSVWTRRNGKRILVQDMSLRHLENAIALLRREVRLLVSHYEGAVQMMPREACPAGGPLTREEYVAERQRLDGWLRALRLEADARQEL